MYAERQGTRRPYARWWRRSRYETANGDGVTAWRSRRHDRLDLARTLLDWAPIRATGRLFAVEMHDATKNGAKDARGCARFETRDAIVWSRCWSIAGDRNQHSSDGCTIHALLRCEITHRRSTRRPGRRRRGAEVMIAKGAQVEWSPTEVKKDRSRARRRRRRWTRANRTSDGRRCGGAKAAARSVRRWTRIRPADARLREASTASVRGDQGLLAAGANATPVAGRRIAAHQAVAREVPISARWSPPAQARCGNKDNLTPLCSREAGPRCPPPATTRRADVPRAEYAEEKMDAVRE